MQHPSKFSHEDITCSLSPTFSAPHPPAISAAGQGGSTVVCELMLLPEAEARPWEGRGERGKSRASERSRGRRGLGRQVSSPGLKKPVTPRGRRGGAPILRRAGSGGRRGQGWNRAKTEGKDGRTKAGDKDNQGAGKIPKETPGRGQCIWGHRRREKEGQRPGWGRETTRAGARALPTLTWEETGPRGPSGVTVGWGGLQLGSDGGEGPKSWGTGAPGSNGAPQTGPSPSVGRRRRFGPRTPAAVPAPTPLRAWRPGRVGRLGPDPPLTSAACRPASPTQTDLSRPPLAPPPPSRRLVRLLPKLFPLIPAPPRPGVTRSAAPPRPRGRDVTAQLGFTPPFPRPFPPEPANHRASWRLR